MKAEDNLNLSSAFVTLIIKCSYNTSRILDNEVYNALL